MKTPTARVIRLKEALETRNVTVETEHWDGHKHVDLYLPEANICIEVDGIQHLIDPRQIISDFKREHYSDIEKFDTLHINNSVLDDHINEIADAIAEVVGERKAQS